ncbi:MAG: hypothetical protein WC986_15035 [Elusimicrobiota bacterium]
MSRVKSGDLPPIVCPCGKKLPTNAYLAAHWNENLMHQCQCGLTLRVLRGHVISAKRNP